MRMPRILAKLRPKPKPKPKPKPPPWMHNRKVQGKLNALEQRLEERIQLQADGLAIEAARINSLWRALKELEDRTPPTPDELQNMLNAFESDSEKLLRQMEYRQNNSDQLRRMKEREKGVRQRLADLEAAMAVILNAEGSE